MSGHNSIQPGPQSPMMAIAGESKALPPALTSTPDALGLLKSLRRRWLLATILGVVGSVGAGAAAWALVPVAKYTATATLEVNTSRRWIIFSPNERGADYKTYQRTQIALIKNPKILGLALADPTVAGLPTIREQVDEIEWLEKQIRVDFLGGSEVLEISLSGDRPDDLAKIVNAVVKAYFDKIVDAERLDRLARLQKLKNLLRNYQNDLNVMRNSMKDLAATAGSNDPKALAWTQQFKAEHLSLTQRELMHAQSEILKAQAQAAALARDPEEKAASTVPDAQVDAIAERSPSLAAPKEKSARARQKYLEATRVARDAGDPSVVRSKAQWDAAEKELAGLRARERAAVARQMGQDGPTQGPSRLAQANEQVAIWKSYAEILEKSIKEAQADTKTIGVKSVDLENQRADIAVADEVARHVAKEVEAVQVELDAPERITELAKARIPKQKDDMRQIRAGGAASVAGLMAALFGVSFWEYRARRVDSPDVVVNGLGIRLVGALPARPNRSRLRTGEALAASDRRWQSLLIESVDLARTVLLHASRADSIRVVMVASAVKGEGKTSLACHLATSLVRAGRKTLLVDCDLRSPSIHRLFGLSAVPGLCEHLRGMASVQEMIHPTDIPGLDVVPAGLNDSMALQCLARDGLREIFDGMKARYDFVIVDSAPILPVADSLLIGQSVDAAIFSVMREVSRVPMIYAAYERLSTLGVKMLGAVVAGVQHERYGPEYHPAAQLTEN